MTISKDAVRKFRKRRLDDHDWLKDEHEADVDEALAELDPPPSFVTEPYLHQKVGFLIGVYRHQFLYFMGMGIGKSKIVLDVFAWRKRGGYANRMIVLVPNVVNISSWVRECQVHQPDLDVLPLDTTGEKRWRLLFEHEYDVAIINYGGLIALGSQKKPGKKKGWQVDPDKADAIADRFDMMILDESTAVKNHNTLTFKVAKRLSRRITYRYALTGTPFGRDPHDLWPQFYLVDGGDTLGQTLGIFRAAFFNEHRNPFSGMPEYRFDRRYDGQLRRMMKNRSIRYSSDECLDLPSQVYVPRYLPFPDSFRNYYSPIVQEIINSQGNYHMVKNAFIRMRQVVSGFLGVTDEETEERIEIEFSTNPRLDELEEVLAEISPDEKVVVSYEFTHSGRLITQLLEKQSIGYEWLYSGTKDAEAAMRRFLDDEDCRVFVMNSKSGAMGLNLQVARYMVFYELPVSPIIREQAEKRIHRAGQSGSVFYYDLIMEHSIDEKIQAFLKEGKDLFDSLVEGGDSVLEEKPSQAVGG